MNKKASSYNLNNDKIINIKNESSDNESKPEVKVETKKTVKAKLGPIAY